MLAIQLVVGLLIGFALYLVLAGWRRDGSPFFLAREAAGGVFIVVSLIGLGINPTPDPGTFDSFEAFRKHYVFASGWILFYGPVSAVLYGLFTFIKATMAAKRGSRLI